MEEEAKSSSIWRMDLGKVIPWRSRNRVDGRHMGLRTPALLRQWRCCGCWWDRMCHIACKVGEWQGIVLMLPSSVPAQIREEGVTGCIEGVQFRDLGVGFS